MLDNLDGELVFEAIARNVGDDGVEVLAGAGGVFTLFGDLTLDEDANALGDTLDTAGPEEVVEGGVNTVVLSAHQSLGEFTDLLDGGGGALVEGAAVEGAASDTTASDLSDGGVLSLLVGGHLGDGAAPALVVALGTGGDGLTLGSDGGDLLFLTEDLTLEGLLDHFLIFLSFLNFENFLEIFCRGLFVLETQ